MSNAIETPGAGEPVPELIANRFTPDAQERVARLRVLADNFPDAFPDEPDAKPLTPTEVRLARQTSPAALEKAAALAEAAPSVSSTVAVAADLREAIAFELAYMTVRDEARAVARRFDMAILRRKIKAVNAARGLYRMGKSYVTVPAGDAVRTHVSDLKHTLTKRRKKTNATQPILEPAPEVKK